MREVSRKQGSASPCAACKLLRRRCTPECIFVPYFPADEPLKFANVHKVFGASNVNKMLQELPEHLRSDAVSSMVYEANARVSDPVYGCVGAISSLQHQIGILQAQLAVTQAEMVHLRMRRMAHHAGLPCGSTESHSTATATTATAPSSKLTEAHAKSFFGLETVLDQANMGEAMWSC